MPHEPSQRSAKSAMEIKGLIAKSAAAVGDGVADAIAGSAEPAESSLGHLEQKWRRRDNTTAPFREAT